VAGGAGYGATGRAWDENPLVAIPGTLLSSPHHYTAFMRCNTSATSRMLRPALVDTKIG
jgi:hypothetical protein